MKWIKTKDRLPNGQDTLIYHVDGEIIIAECSEDIDGNIVFRTDEYRICELKDISHWMELPEEPRTKENFKIEEFDYSFHRHAFDVRRIVELSYENEVFLTPNEADIVWSEYSDGMCAGWLYLPTDDGELLEIIKEYNE